MGFINNMYNRPGKGVAKDEARKKGGARFMELLLRDGSHFLAGNLLACLAAAPGAYGAVMGLYGGQPAAAVLAAVIGGALAGPFLSALYDMELRALRDEAGYWWYTYRKALRNNAKASLLPGAVFGGLLTAQLAALLAMINQQGTTLSYALLFLGVLALSLVQCAFWPQLVLMELPLGKLLKNSVLLIFAYPRRVVPAALLSMLYWGVLLIFAPVSAISLPILGFWYIMLICCMLVYPPLDTIFHIEDRIAEMKAPDVESIMRDDVTSSAKQGKSEQ